MSAGSVVVLFFQYSFLSVLISFKSISLLSFPILLISVVFVKNQILSFLIILSLCIPFHALNSVTFYQPIYRDFICEPGFPIDDYMIEHSYNTNTGLGGVFAQKGFVQKAKYVLQNEKVSMKLNPVAMPNLGSDVLKFQNAIQSKSIIEFFYDWRCAF